MSGCLHKRGEHSEEYRRCLDCGREWLRLGDAWMPIEGWIRISADFLSEPGSEAQR